MSRQHVPASQPRQVGGDVNSKSTHLLWLSSPLRDPRLCLIPSLVEGKQTRLSTAFDKLIGLGYELGGKDPTWQLGIGCDGVCLCIPRYPRDFGGRVNEVSFRNRVGRDWRCALKPIS